MPKRGGKQKGVPRSYQERKKPRPPPPPQRWSPPSLYGTVFPSWWAPDDDSSGWYHGPSSSDDESLFGPWPQGTLADHDAQSLNDEMRFRGEHYKSAKEERRRERELRQWKLEEMLLPKYYSDQESSEEEFVGDDLQAGVTPNAHSTKQTSLRRRNAKKQAATKKGKQRKKEPPAKKGPPKKPLPRKYAAYTSDHEEEFEFQFLGLPRKKPAQPEVSANELVNLDAGKPFIGIPWKSKRSGKNHNGSCNNAAKSPSTKKKAARRRVTGDLPPTVAPPNTADSESVSNLSDHEWHPRRITGDFYVFSKKRNQSSTEDMDPKQQQVYLRQLSADSDSDSSLERLLCGGLTVRPKPSGMP